jgi:hypothetical protein
MFEQIEDKIFAPWSRTREVGPKQPVQGILPFVQRAPQPALVAGPIQINLVQAGIFQCQFLSDVDAKFSKIQIRWLTFFSWAFIT